MAEDIDRGFGADIESSGMGSERREAAAKAEKIQRDRERNAADNRDRDRGIQAATPAAAQAAGAPAVTVAPAVTSTTGAGEQMTGYDAYTKAAMGATPAEAMQAAQAAAAQTAQTQSDQAIRQAVRAGKTAGAMGGQAALGAQGQAADAYSKGLESGTSQYYDLTKLGASLGSEMSNRLAGSEQLQAQKDIAKMQAEAAASESKKNRQQSLLGNIIGGIGGIASLFSDRNLKEDIEPDSLTEGLDAIKGYLYKYKGSDRPEAGVMAQDLEKTKMAPAVVDTPEGKMVDTRRLSTMNTGALAEHEARLKKIEGLVKALGEIPAPRKA